MFYILFIVIVDSWNINKISISILIANETKFPGLHINNNLSWKTHIESIKNKLSSACYVMWLVKPYVTANTLKMI
jgi:hypothetical protein